MGKQTGAACARERQPMRIAPGSAPSLKRSDAVRFELAEFLAGRDSFPLPEEFARAGRAALHDALLKHGAPESWARSFGLPMASARRWTESRIARELDEFMSGRSQWPLQREFKAAGRWRLLQAVYEHGGTHAWAARYGMTVRPRQRPREKWSDENIEACLRGLIERHGRYPTIREMKETSLSLYSVMCLHGGPAYWRRRLRQAPATSAPAEAPGHC